MDKWQQLISAKVLIKANNIKPCMCLCAAMLCFQIGLSIITLSVLLPSQAHANSIFSWFSSKEKQAANESPENVDIANASAVNVSLQNKQNAAFGELVYHYFQEDYQQVLQLVAVGRKQHGFTQLTTDDTDRLNLIQGAAQLQLGMYGSAQTKFESLLGQTTSPYVQANTWFFMAKAGFENKQNFLSERAYAAVLKNELTTILTTSQWHELLYLTAHTRMQLGQDWQTLAKQIPTSNIYSAYLLANSATILFNNQQYAQSSTAFTQAKQAIIANHNGDSVPRFARNLFESLSYYVRPWAWFSPNAKRVARQREESESAQEKNALFDRINVGLGQSLLQQGDLPNAIAVTQNVGKGGAQSQQALLNYGWANAKQNRLQTAMAAWQYLQQNSVGLMSLQANYGLAYALSQQDNLGQAFFALQSTATEIDTALVSLNDFAISVNSETFFTDYQSIWPRALDDIQLDFFAATQNFDASYLLEMRMQAKQIQANIAAKQTRIEQLTTFLQERESVYQQRLNSLSLSNASEYITLAQQHINRIERLMQTPSTFEQELALAKHMSNDTTQSHINRLTKAQARQQRLAADTTRKRPLKASYKERLDFLNGIIKWQLSDNFIDQQWQHELLLEQAQQTLNNAQAQYNSLQNIAQSNTLFLQKREKFTDITQQLARQSLAAENVHKTATRALTSELLALIESRRQQLQSQSVNTRLAMLRIQDLQQQPLGQK